MKCLVCREDIDADGHADDCGAQPEPTFTIAEVEAALKALRRSYDGEFERHCMNRWEFAEQAFRAALHAAGRGRG